MTAAYLLSPRAAQDVEDIWAYTAAQWGVIQAETYIRQLFQAIAVVADICRVSKREPLGVSLEAGPHGAYIQLGYTSGSRHVDAHILVPVRRLAGG